MKKIYLQTFLIVLGGLLPTLPVLAQCCPYIDSVSILPENPTAGETVYLSTTVTTPGQGAYLGYTLTNNSGQIAVEACYYSGPLTALQTFTDTINLGVYPVGNHQINFLAFVSDEAETCLPSDTTSVSLSFQVTGSLNTTQAEPAISLYPNPVADVLNIVSTKVILKAELHDLTGKVLRTVTAAEAQKQQIDMNQLNEGVYFLRIYFSDGTENVRKILKQH